MAFKFDKPNLSFTRDRTIEKGQPIRDVPAEDPPVQDLSAMAENAAKVRQKAETLRKAIANANAQRFIPVLDHNRTTRAAVQRLLGGTDGSAIPFTLWERLINDSYDRANRVPLLDLSDNLTGDIYSDSFTITELSGEPPLWPFITQMLVILLANRLMGAFSAVDRQAMTASKVPPSSELGAFIAQLALAFSAYQAVQGLENFTEVQASSQFSFITDEQIDQLSGDIQNFLSDNSDGLFDPSDSHTQFQADRQIAIDYGRNWLVNNTKPGYEGWIRYPFIRDIENRMEILGEQDPLWSEAVGAGRLAVSVSKDLLAGFSCDIEAASAALDRAAASLRSQYSAEAICCLMRILVELGAKVGDTDLKFLTTIKAFLRFYIVAGSGLKIGNFLNNYLKGWEGVLRRRYSTAVTTALRRYFQSFANPVLRFLEKEELHILNACTPFDELLEFILKALEDVEENVREFLIALYDDIEFNYQDQFQIDIDLPQVERARSLLNLIQALEDSIRSGILNCGKDNTQPVIKPDDLAEVVNRTSDLQPVRITLPEPVGDSFLDFNPVDWEAGGIKVPVYAGRSTEQLPAIKMVTNCLKRIPSEIVPEIPELKEF